MRVKQQEVADLLLAMLNELQLKTGGHVTRRTLGQGWRRIGLRDEDLILALDALQTEKWLLFDSAQPALDRFQLTEDGFRLTQAADSVFSLKRGHKRLRKQAEKRARKSERKPEQPPTTDRRRVR